MARLHVLRLRAVERDPAFKSAWGALFKRTNSGAEQTGHRSASNISRRNGPCRRRPIWRHPLRSKAPPRDQLNAVAARGNGKTRRFPIYSGALREALSKEPGERPEYWRAFRRGVQRGFEGLSEVSEVEHNIFLHHDHRDIAEGYRDGVAYRESLSRMAGG